MRTSHVLGYVGLVALAVATYSVTTRAVGLARQTRPSPDRVQLTDTERRAPRAPGHAALGNEAPFVRNGVSTNDVKVVDVTAGQGGIIVEAAAVLSNGIEDRRFVWELTVRPRGEQVPARWERYDRQIGLSRRGSVVKPTFTEGVELPPGEYDVAIAIQEVPPGGVKTLDDPKVAESMTMASDSRAVRVP